MSLIKPIGPNVWWTPTSFRMFFITKINNNMLFLKVDSPRGKVLVAVNAVKSTPALFAEVRELEKKESAQLFFVILGSDWHHLYAREWAEEFKLPIYFAGKRPVRLHNDEAFQKIILNKMNPVIDRLDVQLVPWLGFNGPLLATLPDERDRCELSVFHHGTLFIFDVLIPISSQLPDFLQGGFAQWISDRVHGGEPRYWQNTIGFRPRDRALCKASAEALVNLPVHTIVFAHGDAGRGAVVQGADQCKALLQEHLGHFAATRL